MKIFYNIFNKMLNVFVNLIIIILVIIAIFSVYGFAQINIFHKEYVLFLRQKQLVWKKLY